MLTLHATSPPDAGKNAIHDLLDETLCRFKKKSDVVLLAGLNAELGSVRTAEIGSHGADLHNDNGRRARELSQANGIRPPNTFMVGEYTLPRAKRLMQAAGLYWSSTLPGPRRAERPRRVPAYVAHLV